MSVATSSVNGAFGGSRCGHLARSETRALWILPPQQMRPVSRKERSWRASVMWGEYWDSMLLISLWYVICWQFFIPSFLALCNSGVVNPPVFLLSWTQAVTLRNLKRVLIFFLVLFLITLTVSNKWFTCLGATLRSHYKTIWLSQQKYTLFKWSSP